MHDSIIEFVLTFLFCIGACMAVGGFLVVAFASKSSPSFGKQVVGGAVAMFMSAFVALYAAIQLGL